MEEKTNVRCTWCERRDNSAIHGRPALIPSRDRSDAYGRTKVPNPNGEHNVVHTPNSHRQHMRATNGCGKHKPPSTGSMRHHTQLSRDTYPLELISKTFSSM